MNQELIDKGLKTRRDVLRDEYMDASIKNLNSAICHHGHGTD